MGELIDSLDLIDRHLLFPFDAAFSSTLILEDIKAGSIRSVIRTVVEAVDDEALKDGDWKKVVGRFLLKGKYRLLEFLADKKEITSREQVIQLEGDLRQLAHHTGVKRIPNYDPIPTSFLLYDISALTKAVAHLDAHDNAIYTVGRRRVSLNKEFSFNIEEIEKLMTKKVLSATEKVTVQVKKPDYLGNSMWDIRYHGHVIPAKIDDVVWLEQFQNRARDVRPGDGLLVDLETRTSIGFQNEVVAKHYNVVRVHEVVKLPPYGSQLEFE